MRYVLRQKLLAWGDDYRIKDDAGRDRFEVDGRAVAIGSHLVLRDQAGTEVARIDQKLLAWGPTYEVRRGDELAAVVKRRLFSLFRHRFTVDVPGPDDLEAVGDFLDHEYEFHRAGRVVATVTKRWLSLADSYGIDVADGEDDVLVLASAVVIDLACHPDGDDHG